MYYSRLLYYTIQYNFIAKCQYTVRGMFCGAKYTHQSFTPIIKHLITTANKHINKKSPGKKPSIDNNMIKPHWHQAVHITSNKMATSRGPPLESFCPNKSNYKNYLQQINQLPPPAYSAGRYHPDPSKTLRTKNIPAWTQLTREWA